MNSLAAEETRESTDGLVAPIGQCANGLSEGRAALEHFKLETSSGAPVEGWYRADLVGLRDAFMGLHAGASEEPEIGSTVSVFAEGALAAEMWGGWSNRDRTEAWRQDTLVQMQSATKGVVITAIHMLVDRGLLDLDAPVARYWPEFAASDKGRITTRHVLTQTSGLVFAEGLSPGDFYRPDVVAAALAAQPALWEAGSQAGYQLFTQGFLLGEILRRIDGRTIGRFVREEISGPLHADLHIGLNDEQIARAAEVVFPEAPVQQAIDPESLVVKSARGMPGPPPAVSNIAEWRRAEIPAGNAHATARGLARIYAAAAAAGTERGLFSRATLDDALIEQHNMTEVVLGRQYHTASGYLLHSPPIVELAGRASAFGHHGVGGSIGFADFDGEIGFAYLANRLHARPTNGPRSTALIDAFYRALS